MRRCAEHLYNFVKDSKCASIAHFPLFFFTFMFSLVLSGCDKNADTPDIPEAHKEVYKMKDGLIVRVNSEINYYETEDSFFCNNYTQYPQVHIPDIKRDSVYGYDEMDTLKWEKAVLGSWVSKYGLVPGAEYFVQTIQVTIRIPDPYSDSDFLINQLVYKENEVDSIGIRLDTNKRGFFVYKKNWAYTIIKQIGYDKCGNSIKKYYPITPSDLKWKYGSLKIEW